VDSGRTGAIEPASIVTAESPEANIPAASARPDERELRTGDEVWATISPANRTAGLEASQPPFNAAEISIDATRLRVLVEPARNAGRVGGLGGGVVIRQVLATFPVQNGDSKVLRHASSKELLKQELQIQILKSLVKKLASSSSDKKSYNML
jgi:hypothetical protein